METGAPSTTGDNASYAYNITNGSWRIRSTESTAAALQWCRENLGLSYSDSWFMNALEFSLYGDPAVKPFKAAAGATISGTVWNDADHNGVKDGGETGQSGWTVYIDTNNNGTLDGGEQSVVSGSGGSLLVHGASGRNVYRARGGSERLDLHRAQLRATIP